MKKIIFKNFLRETTIFFLLSCSSVALIVWVIQAVNYLGFVTEDGHGFKIYFMYTLLSLPKIVNEILPFMFFFAVFFTLVKYEDQNQTLIFWSNGIKKSEFLNIIIIELLYSKTCYKKLIICFNSPTYRNSYTERGRVSHSACSRASSP